MITPKNLTRVAEWLGISWTASQEQMLQRYAMWLVDEAIPAGGLGPQEGPRVFDRHIADSLAFVRLMQSDATTVVDVGSGVGLPAIPIGIALPDLAVTVLDRSERRTRLAARAIRILRLQNVSVATTDAENVTETYDVVTFRASLPIDAATSVFQRLATDGGEGLFAWSRGEKPEMGPIDALATSSDTTFSMISEGTGVLDSAAWILKMQRSR